MSKDDALSSAKSHGQVSQLSWATHSFLIISTFQLEQNSLLLLLCYIMQMCMLQSTQAQGWERLMLSPASGKVWIAECTGSELGKADSHLCLIEILLQICCRFSFKKRFWLMPDKIRINQYFRNFWKANPGDAHLEFLHLFGEAAGSQVRPIQAVKPDDTNEK